MELWERLGRDGQHIAFLAFVAPDFLRCHARLFQRHGAQVEAGTAPGVVGQLGKGVAQATRAHVVDGQNGVARALCPAVVDDLLRTALDFGVAALNRVKVQRRSVGTRGHGACGAATHANAHARAAQLDEQRTGGEQNFLGLVRVDHAQTARNHDGLVVTANHRVGTGGHGLLVLTEVAQ